MFSILKVFSSEAWAGIETMRISMANMDFIAYVSGFSFIYLKITARDSFSRTFMSNSHLIALPQKSGKVILQTLPCLSSLLCQENYWYDSAPHSSNSLCSASGFQSSSQGTLCRSPGNIDLQFHLYLRFPLCLQVMRTVLFPV